MTSSRALAPFQTSVFSVFSRLARDAGAVNLGQGFPDFDGPDWILDAAHQAMRSGHNQYAMSHGATRLRRAIAGDNERRLALAYDVETEITVTSGATEAVAAAMLGLLDPGDEVLTFEPYYDSYPVCVAMAGATLRAVPLRAPTFTFDRDELAAAFARKPKMFVLNTPHNPTGRVLRRDELEFLVDCAQRAGTWIVSDEVYEQLVFKGHEHLSPAQLDQERTIRVSSAAKTFSLTGWKVGWACGPSDLMDGLRRAHQSLVFSTAAPLQDAIAQALEQAPERGYYDEFLANYTTRRDHLQTTLEGARLDPIAPEGTYFTMARYPGDETPNAFARRLIEEKGVASIPPESFYEHKAHAQGLIRFAFCKTLVQLNAARERLRG